MAHYYDSKTLECFDCDIRKARKEGLFPSVTTKLGILAKEGLTIWRIQQAVMSALTMPRKEDEPEEEYVKRIYKDADEQSKSASGLGTEFHTAAEKYFRKEEYSPSDERVREMIVRLDKWAVDMEIVPLVVEEVFVNHDLKLACRVDIVFRCFDGDVRKTVIADFKTQNVKDDKMRAYDEWLYQLAGNRICYGLEVDALWNIVVSTNPETLGNIYVKKWTHDERINGIGVFINLNKLYNCIKEI